MGCGKSQAEAPSVDGKSKKSGKGKGKIGNKLKSWNDIGDDMPVFPKGTKSSLCRNLT